jgi:pimeloyl-[acyl-carrier protein] methyl ester esterase
MLTLVLLPGLDGTCRLFDPLIQALGSTVPVQTIPYPVSESLGYRELESLVRESLPKSDPYILVGESFSGPIAVSIAATKPSNMKGLILCCSFVRNPQPMLQRFRSLLRFAPITSTSIRIMSNLVLGRYNRGKITTTIVEATKSLSHDVIRKRIEEVMDVDVSEELSQVVIPSMYLRASHDRVVPRSASELISSILPDIQIKTLDGPHFILQAAPVESGEMIAEFMREVENAL